MRNSLKHLIIRYSSYLLGANGVGGLLRPWTAGRGVIFTLHRVLPESDRPFQPNKLLEITPEFLRAAVAEVREHGYEFVSLDEALLRLRHPEQTHKRFAVLTFDDGYKDNRDVALPILKELGVPFTVFISSEFSRHASELWWVMLERLISERDEIELRYGDQCFVAACTELEEKESAFAEARAFLIEQVLEEDQRAVVREAAERYEFDLKALAEELILSFEELRTFAQEPLVSLGAHTDTHPMLARLTHTHDILAHMAQGLEQMELELGLRPRVLAYPYGFEDAVDGRCEAAAKELGFEAAVTTQPGTVSEVCLQRRPHHLPRISLNGLHQNRRMVSVYLCGAAFVFLRWARTLRHMLRKVRA